MPDTVGYTTPTEIRALFEYLRANVKGADGVVFVADSQPECRDSNLESFESLRDNIAELEKFYVCRCGSEKCRGSIMAPPKKRKRKKKKAGGGRRT